MTPEDESALARATIRIFHNWKVDDALACRILGLGNCGEFADLRTGGSHEIHADVLDRMALILTIHACLRAWFRDPARGYGWMHRPNLVFENMSPIELLKAGNGSALVRLKIYLDAEMQGW
jgi:hypothetical protein